MPGVVENMPVEARLERLRALAEAILSIVRERGSMTLIDALSATAARLRTAVSQVKQGLNYALSNSMLRLTGDDMLSATA